MISDNIKTLLNRALPLFERISFGDIIQSIQATLVGGTAGTAAILDQNGKVPLANMPASVFTYKGVWNAATNTPELADGVGTSGDTYRVTHAGSVDFGAGAISFAVGDKAVYNGTVWEKWDVQDDDIGEVGSYKFFAGDTPGAGYIVAEGQLEDTAEFPRLFNYLGTKYGGNGTTTFGIPDARGLVMVGAGAHGTMTRANGTAYNGGTVGATRNDQIQGFALPTTSGNTAGTVLANNLALATRVSRGLTLAKVDATLNSSDFSSDGTNGTPRTGDETRPAEIAVLVCIKY